MAKTLLGAAVTLLFCFLALTAVTPGWSFVFVGLAVVTAIVFRLVRE